MNTSPYETEPQSPVEKEHSSERMAPDYYDSEQSYLMQEVQNLRDRNSWLTGAVVTLFFCLGGLGAWLFFTNLESQEKANLEESTQVQTPIETRIQQLEQDIEALRQQIPDDLTESLRINQSGIQRLESQLQQLIGELDGLQVDLPNVEIPSNSSELDELLEDGPFDQESDNPSAQTEPDGGSNPEKSN